MQIPALLLELVYDIAGTDSVRELTGRGQHPVESYVFHGARAALLGDTSEAKRVLGPPRYGLFDWAIHGVPHSAAHFKLGQLYLQVGDAAEAAEHYASFLHTFADPDPDPEYEWMVGEAREELEKLARGR